MHIYTQQKKNRKGFTLLEILIVIALIGGLTAFVITRVTENANRARIKDTETRALSVHSALMQFRSDLKRYPETSEGLDALIQRPSKNGDLWRGPYASEDTIKDGWDNPFEYELTPKGPRLISRGENLDDPADDLYFLNGKPEAQPAGTGNEGENK